MRFPTGGMEARQGVYCALLVELFLSAGSLIATIQQSRPELFPNAPPNGAPIPDSPPQGSSIPAGNPATHYYLYSLFISSHNWRHWRSDAA